MSDNIFYTKFSELSGERYDANTYHKERLEAIKKLELSTFELKKLKYLTPFNKNIVTTNEDELPYIGLVNIESNTGIYLQTSEKETFSSAVAFKKGQVLFPKLRPYLNKVYIAEFDGLCSTEFHIFDSSIINNRFLAIFLQSDLVVSQTKHLMSGNTLPRLQTEDIENLLVPIPAEDIQNQIISKMEQAYKQKEQKEKEASDKLKSIDTYLLNELGIKPFSDEKERLEDRVFFRKFCELSGGRLDAPSNHSTFSFEQSNFNLVNFKDFIQIDPSLTIKDINSDTIASFVPMEKISDIYANAVTDEVKYWSQSNGYTKFQDSDLLWSKITPCMENGKSAVVENLQNRVGFGSTEYFVFRAKNNQVNIKYIHALLRLKKLREKAKLFFSGTSGHQRVSKDFFLSFQIPLPPIEIQNEIANHIQNLRDEAQALKNEAIQIFEDEKKEVEKMILGDVK